MLEVSVYLSVDTVVSRGPAVTKSDLVQVVYRCHGGISRRESAGIIDLLLDRIKKELRQQGKVQVSGFGSFQVVWREARKGRNPKTGDRDTDRREAGCGVPAFQGPGGAAQLTGRR